MEEEKKQLPQEEETTELPQEEKKHPWQKRKESWYDKVPLTVKQLDLIIWIATGLLILTFIVIFMDAYGVF